MSVLNSVTFLIPLTLTRKTKQNKMSLSSFQEIRPLSTSSLSFLCILASWFFHYLFYYFASQMLPYHSPPSDFFSPSPSPLPLRECPIALPLLGALGLSKIRHSFSTETRQSRPLLHCTWLLHDL